MAENPDDPQAPLFRPSKRRKVFRKRIAEEDDQAAELQEDAAELDESRGATDPSQQDANEQQPVVRRPVAKKHGIGFSSSGTANPGAGRQDVPTETALVPVVDKEAGDALRSDRFTKPTGKASVVEDKHLYVQLLITIKQVSVQS